MNVNKEYDFINAKFENGAILYNNWAVYLGGPNDGSATIEVYVDKDGEYEIILEYSGANRLFKLDINGVSTQKSYVTSSQCQSNILVAIDLKTGYSELKFHGQTPIHGPYLKSFMLSLSKSKILNYNLINGILSNGAKIDKNMVVDIGGKNKGEVSIDVSVSTDGYYGMIINFNRGLRAFLLDINEVNNGQTYIMPASLYGIYYLEINLNNGVNKLRFYGVGTKLAPNLGNFTLQYINNPSPTTSINYSVAKGILENGARLNSTKNLVLNLGGIKNGSSTVTVNVLQAGSYNIEVEFRNGFKPLKLSINGIDINSIFFTPEGSLGKFTTVINLKIGPNKIKFHGVNGEYASNLGGFTLNFVSPKPIQILPQEIYDSANGVFENGANLDINTNFVTGLGGEYDGSTTVEVNAVDIGLYDLEIEYLATDSDRVLCIDVNGVTMSVYNVFMTNGLSLTDVQLLNVQVNLDYGKNEIKFHGNLINYAPMIGIFKLKLKNTSLLPLYNFADLNKLSYKDLIDLLKKIQSGQITDALKHSIDAVDFYNDDNRVQEIINELGRSGQYFTDKDEQGIETLVEVLKIGFKIAMDYKELNKLNDIDYKNKCIPSIMLVLNNKNFKLGTSIQDRVVKAIPKLIRNTSANVEIINNFANILIDFENNLATYSNDKLKVNAVHTIIEELREFLYHERFIKRVVVNTIFYNNINIFLDIIESLAQQGLNFSKYSEKLASEFIHSASFLSIFRKDTKITHSILTECLNIYPYLSRLYLEVLKELKNEFYGILDNGESIEYSIKINEAKRKYTPKRYKFDNGQIIIKAGDMISKNSIKSLYWASKEVEAQFMRIANNDIPINPTNPDAILNIVIYNSPKEYELNSIIYGFNVDNGGLYLEPIGTLFTYEREVPKDDVLSLEELFRHEYAHYLEAKYLIPGIIGRNKFYSWNPYRLLWFNEGIAEFFSGATRKSGVQPSKNIVDDLVSNKNRLSVSELLVVKRESFNFYKYAFAFVYYMYTRQLEQFLIFSKLLKTDDVARYEANIMALMNDNLTNSLYEQTLNDLIANVSNYKTPTISKDYLISHPENTTNQIKNDILSEISMSSVLINTLNSTFYETFTLSGNYNNGISLDEVSDWQSMDKKLNDILEKLDKKSWSGYKTVTAYFTNYKVDINENAIFKIVFHGILKAF